MTGDRKRSQGNVAPPTDVLLVGNLASVHVRRLATALHESGLAVRVAGFEGEPIDGVPTHALGSLPAARDRRYGLAIPRLARLIRASEPRIVHAHYLTSFGLMATLASKLADPTGSKSALVQSVWGSDLLVTARRSTIHRLLAMVSLRAATLVTGDSLELADEVRRLAPKSRYVRFNFGPPEPLLTMTRHPQDLIVSSRRLDPDTRIDVVLEGFRLAKSRSPTLVSWRLVVAGHGRDEDRLRSMSMGWEDVRFVGQLDAETLVALLLTAGVFISIPRSDGTSAALLEAMASGATPIVTDLPANREWVDGEVGVVVPNPPSADDVARAMETAIARGPTPETVRARVRDTTWEREVARLITAYGTIHPVRADRGVT